MRRACLLLIAACSGGASGVDAQPDARLFRYSWTFRDAAGNDVGCPPGVTSVELTGWRSYPYPGDSCTGWPNSTVDRVETVPCEPGEVWFDTQFAERLDFKLADGRVYAREFPVINLDPHVDVNTPRGFVALAWEFYNPTKMMTTWCDSYSRVTTTWVGPHEFFPCTQGSPMMAMLPGQPVGDVTFDVWTTSPYEHCGNVFQKKTLSVTIAADQTADAMVQFTTSQ
jgi:hypothetical protein